MIKHPLYPNGNIYLSGGMQYAENLGAGWRQDCGERLKQMGFYPLDIAALDIAYAEAHGHLYRFLSDEELLQRKSNIRKHFIETDINLIRNDTDAIIILYDESVRLGAGTTSEIHEAFMLDIPVFLLNAYGTLDEVPGWMQAETTKMFNDWEEMYAYMAALPQGILKRDIYGNRRSGDYYLCSLCGAVEEKHKTHFVSKVSPLYCKSCVELVKETFETHKDRYQFFIEYLEQEAAREVLMPCQTAEEKAEEAKRRG
jgi:hypothetical protein